MSTQKIYAVMCHTDLEEGRGPARIVGFFHDETKAKLAEELLPGVFGTPNNLTPVPYPVYDSLEEFALANGIDTPAIEEKRRRALSKLTPEERKLLGVDPAR